MWLSKQAARSDDRAPADMGTVTIGGDSPAVLTDSESRNISVISPGGYIWRPAVGDELLIIKNTDGEKCAVGASKAAAYDEVLPGEVLIYSKGAHILIKNDGDIEISGNIKVDGSIDAGGGVYSDGVKIG